MLIDTDFDSVTDSVIKEFRSDWKVKYPEMTEAVEIVLELASDYMKSGKRIRPVMMALIASDYMGGCISPEMTSKLLYLGSCYEAINSVPTILDDMMDEGVTRRGLICWHRRAGIGIKCCMDCLCLFEFGFDMFKNISDLPHINHIVYAISKRFQDVNIGQFIDWSTALRCRKDPLNEIKSSIHKELAYRKTSAVFEAAIHPGLIAGGATDPYEISETISITMEMGWLFQIENDYLDIFGVPEVIGKIPSDIKEASLNWITAKAIEMASGEQKEVIRQNIGKDDAACIESVMDVFEELDMYTSYKEHEESMYKSLVGRINRLNSKGSPALRFMLDYFYRREK